MAEQNWEIRPGSGDENWKQLRLLRFHGMQASRQGEYAGGQAPYGRRVAVDGARLEPDSQKGSLSAPSPPSCISAGSAAGRAGSLRRRMVG